MKSARIDFESRSACSLRKSGSWKYSQDPTTEVLCMGFRMPYWEKGKVSLWHPAFPTLGILESTNQDELCELFLLILGGGLVEAHNAWFERGIWQNIMVPRYGWPPIQPQQWRCSAAKAAAHALPRSLQDATAALGPALGPYTQKDMEGHKVMLKVSKPRKPRKAEREAGVKGLLWHESKELFERLWAYCKQDVLAEEALSEALPDLSPAETQIYLLDQTINERGFQLDREAVTTALDLIKQETATLNKELVTLTGGSPSKATQRKQMLNWFAEQWFILDDTQAATIEETLKEENLDVKVRRGLEIIQLLGRSSTAKYEAMQNWAGADGRVRGGLLYHGASTGRWSGAGVQPHNFPKGKIKDIEGAWSALKSRDLRTICSFVYDGEAPVGDALKLLSQSLRGAIIASPGKKLFVADYAAIEARVVLWLAGDEEALGIFQRNEDIYCDMASDIYGYPVVPNPERDPPERALGKIAILGLGYQMGWSKFVATCATFGIEIDDELAQRTVNIYRERFWRVTDLWANHNSAAIQATTQNKKITLGNVSWEKNGRFLYCTLPSGRRLAYPDAEVKARETPWGEMRPALTYKGVSALKHKWMRQPSYGGMLIENIVQAVSRDIMAEAIVRLEESRIYQPVLSVHDEIVAEANQYLGDIREYDDFVSCCPLWATGLPVATKSWSGFRYRK